MQRALPLHGEIRRTAEAPRLALARKGFRPFFLLAAGFASLILPSWLLVLFGVVPSGGYLDPTSWHAHEMIFGYAVAVIAGFLLTAVGNWTQRETAVGTPLLGLAGVWLFGRLAMSFSGGLIRGVPAFLDLAFLPLLFLTLARPLVAAKSRRNYVMLAVVAALFGGNVVVHLDALGVLPPGSGRRASLAAVDLVVLLCATVSGRVIPMFTRNATGAEGIASIRSLDVAAAIALALLVAIDAALPGASSTLIVSAVAGALVLARTARWGAPRTLRHPLLWILHAGHAWLGVGLLLRALPLAGVPLAPSVATHALTVGAVGGLTLGMMARVALGHTGRPLSVPRSITFAFALVTLAALVRVAGPLVLPVYAREALVLAGTSWTIAFAIYLLRYAPSLVQPRLDGKPG